MAYTYNAYNLGQYTIQKLYEVGDEVSPPHIVQHSMLLQWPTLQQPNFQEELFPRARQLRPPHLVHLTQPRNKSPLGEQIKEAGLSPLEKRILPMAPLRRPTFHVRQLSSQQSTQSHRASPPLCKDPSENLTHVLLTTEEKIQSDGSEAMKKSSDSSNSDYKSGNLGDQKLYDEKFAPEAEKWLANEWRRRQNMYLSRILKPTNALNVLNQMLSEQKGISQLTVYPDVSHSDFNASHEDSFCAEFTVDGRAYKGYGPSEQAARNAAAEHALRDLFFKHLVKLQRRQNEDANNLERLEDEAGQKIDDEEETLPMIQLANFALYKLFAEWECDGRDVSLLKVLARPATRTGDTAGPAPVTSPGGDVVSQGETLTRHTRPRRVAPNPETPRPSTRSRILGNRVGPQDNTPGSRCRRSTTSNISNIR